MSRADGLACGSSDFAARDCFYPPRTDRRRLVVRPLGRELRLWHERCAARTGNDREINRPERAEGCGLAQVRAKFRRRLWRIDPFLLRRDPERKREEHRFANGVGTDWLARRSGAKRRARGARGRVAGGKSEGGRI